MDILSMTVGECMKNERIKALLKEYVPDLERYPLMLFARKTVGEMVDMAIKQGMVSKEEAERMLKIAREKLG